jgi:hypothetical protein
MPFQEGPPGECREGPETNEDVAMPYFLVKPNGIGGGRSDVKPKVQTRNMEIKIKGLVRRQLVYGFEAEKDAEGQIVGSSVVKLARRNAFELVGLKRPALAPTWRWKMG